MPKLYDVIYADPPYSYRNKKTGCGMKSGSEAKYSTLTLEEICDLKIPAEKNSVLFLWITVPLLPYGFKIMESWGFNYKTIISWNKIMGFGMGYWWRGQVEILMFGTRGKIKAFRMQERNIIQTKVGEHSTKPEEFRQLIERATPHLPKKLELFARKESPGWDVFGNEVNNSIEL